jgi:two-component system phosphate regulon response regulator PhoB
MQRVLIVEDDPEIQGLVSYNLSQAGFEVTAAGTGRMALESINKQPPDMIILDLMLPDIDGMEVCRLVKQHESLRRIPIIMLTARGDEIDRVVGFELGADDYVPKPFSPRELVLRVQSIFRRMKDQPGAVLHLGRIELYPDRHECFVGKRQIALTAKEFNLLEHLIRASGKVLTREALMDTVWEYHGEATSRTLDTHVRRLREKLGAEGAHIETVRGVGYRARMPVKDS